MSINSCSNLFTINILQVVWQNKNIKYAQIFFKNLLTNQNKCDIIR